MAGKISKSFESVKECIIHGQSFIVEAGAGSGKTWILIESLKYITETQSEKLERENKQIACITYTNVAKDEIIDRIDNNPLVLVLTIHEFLWLVMKNYQKELKNEIIKFNNADTKKSIEQLEEKIKKVNIDYSQYGRKFDKGKITHEDVLEFSRIIFNTYPKISTIVANKFPYIFVDEYQDTEKRTIELLLNDLLKNNSKKLTVGFFGDSMQKIYTQGVGRIPQEYLDNDTLKLITKRENYRCSKKVISLLGEIRTDLIQEPAGNNLDGETIFIHCNKRVDNGLNYNVALEYLKNEKGWIFGQNTKILFLTHKGIANQLGYDKLLFVYDKIIFGRDRLLNKEEMFSNFFLNKLEVLIKAFQDRNYKHFLKLLGLEGFLINAHNDKKGIQDLMQFVIELRTNKTVKQVMNFVLENNLLVKSARMEEYLSRMETTELHDDEQRDKEFYDALMELKYSEYIAVNNFIENFTPYSTKHGVKGTEYDNVLVVIDDNLWNQYKFNDVFANIKTNQGRYDRTLNLFYVCCSRAKDKLAVLALSNLSSSALGTVENWFGKSNIIDITQL